MDIAIIDYNAGNTQSVKEAVRRCGFRASVTSDWERIRKADRVIFPGVGHAASAWSYLKQSRLDKLLPNLTQPVLGICLGLQLLCSASEEAEKTGIGVFAVQVKRFPGGLKVPHMGWNTLDVPGDRCSNPYPPAAMFTSCTATMLKSVPRPMRSVTTACVSAPGFRRTTSMLFNFIRRKAEPWGS